MAKPNTVVSSKSDSDGIRFADLPLVSILDKKSMKKAQGMLEELQALVESQKAAKEREDEIKLELEEMQNKAGAAGLRYGGLCYVAKEVAGRRTLDKGLLIENGVGPEVIEASMKQGAGFVTRTFKVIEV